MLPSVPPTGRRTPRLSRCRFGVLAVALFSVLAVWSTWPLGRCALHKLPLGAGNFVTVPLFNLWTVWWNADRAAHGFAEYWDAPIFFPTEDAFAFSEPQPLTVMVAPVIWVTGSRVLAYNSYLWLSLILNGVFAVRLLRVLGLRRAWAVSGAAAVILLPAVHWQREVLQLIPLWGILWSWTAFLQLAQRPTHVRGLELGCAGAVTVFACVHHALFLSVLLFGCLWTAWDRLRASRFWAAAAVAALVGGLLTLPLIVELRTALARHEFVREPGLAADFAARPADYSVAYGQRLWSFGDLGARPHWQTGAGWFRYGLAATGLVFGLFRRRWRRGALFLLTTALLAFLLSLGPHLELAGWQPWRTLTAVVPGFAQVRSVFRFAYFFQLAIVLLAVLGLNGLWLWKRAVVGSRRALWVTRTAFAILTVLYVCEVRPAPVTLAPVPDVQPHEDWIAFLRTGTSTESGSAALCLPMAPGNLTQDFERSVRWMYLGTFHGVPLVNGYSGFFPESYFEIRERVRRDFPEDTVLQQLRDLEVTCIVLDRRSPFAQAVAPAMAESHSLESVFESASGMVVYRLRQSPE